jgi:XTP/dITP diphosphohydrolase
MKLQTGERLLFATHNRGKVEEVAQLLAPFRVSVVSAADLGLPEPEETESTFVGNARIKARAASAASGLPALADDSGIEVLALGGAPGVHTADWATLPDGKRDFLMAMTRTRAELLSVGAAEPWRAAFRCTLVLARPDGNEQVFEGSVEGRLVWPLRGALGHGYDPMFLPNGHDRTFAEMTAEEKNRISHRARAFEKFVAVCLGG